MLGQRLKDGVRRLSRERRIGDKLHALLPQQVDWLRRYLHRVEIERRYATVLEKTPLAGHQHAVTQRHLELLASANALLAQPHLWHNVEVDDYSPVQRAVDRGNGVVLASVHSPTMWVGAAAFTTALGHEVLWVAADQPLALTAGDAVRATGSTFVELGSSYRRLSAQLQRGGFVGLLIDIPGSTNVTFMNRPAFVNSGFARLARWHEASILPGLISLDDGSLRLRLAHPVEATRDMSQQSICDEVFGGLNSLLIQQPYLWYPFTSDLWSPDCLSYRWGPVAQR